MVANPTKLSRRSEPHYQIETDGSTSFGAEVDDPTYMFRAGTTFAAEDQARSFSGLSRKALIKLRKLS
jgi:hypothetical protein